MAQKFYLYSPDVASNPDSSEPDPYIISAEESVMALYDSVIFKWSAGSTTQATAPTAYDTVDLAVAASANAIVVPGLSPRGVTVDVDGFGSAFLPILSSKGVIASGHLNGDEWSATLHSHTLYGLTPFPSTPITEGALTASISGYRNESRNSN